MELWGPLIDPGNENFEQLWKRLGQGFKATIIAAVLAIVCSLLFGTALAILRVQLRSVRTVPGVQVLISVLNWSPGSASRCSAASRWSSRSSSSGSA
jgi:ABC-type amino acid transport system permease subunit